MDEKNMGKLQIPRSHVVLYALQYFLPDGQEPLLVHKADYVSGCFDCAILSLAFRLRVGLALGYLSLTKAPAQLSNSQKIAPTPHHLSTSCPRLP